MLGVALRRSGCRCGYISAKPHVLPHSSRFISNITRFSQQGVRIADEVKRPEDYLNGMGVAGPNLNLSNLLSAPSIVKRAEELAERQNELFHGIASIPSHNLNFSTILQPLLEFDRIEGFEYALLTFARHVAPQPQLRSAAAQAEAILNSAAVQNSMRVDVFNKLQEYQQQIRQEGQSGESLSSEQKRALEKIIRDGTRNGLHLSEPIREEMIRLKNEMNERVLAYSSHLNEENERLGFRAEDLRGLDPQFLNSLEMGEEGSYRITLKYPHVLPILKYCSVPETREKVERAFQSRCMTLNDPLVHQVLALREREAHLLGFKNHAHFKLDILMAEKEENVEQFLMDLWAKLKGQWAEEKEELLDLKKEECLRLGLEFDGKLNLWDLKYYVRIGEEEKFNVNQEALREFFPLEIVNQKILEMFETLFGLEFIHLTKAQVWHEQVKAYQVRDEESGQVMGYLYLDLHPREGKYGHACCIPLRSSCVQGEGEARERQTALVAILANFTPPTSHTPSLLYHHEVETLLHEYGHALHMISSSTETSVFSGATAVEKDFLECPSQMMENWAWEKESLSLISHHYETGEKLGGEMLTKLLESKRAYVGVRTLRQIVLALSDQRFHTGKASQTFPVYKDILAEVMGLEGMEGTSIVSTFSHIMGGYSARYYSYLWSQVYSMDLFVTKFGGGNLLKGSVGREYRRMILEKGASMDGGEMLSNYLGREPQNDAFLESKGIAIPSKDKEP